VRYDAELGAALSQEWDRLVAAHPGADVTQLCGWGRLRRTAGYQPSYLLAYRGGQLVGGAQLLRRRLPVAGAIGYLPYGPLMFTTTEPDTVAAALSDALRDLPALGLKALFIQPPDAGHPLSEQLLSLGFRHSNAGIAPRASARLDLRLPEDQLRAGLGRKLRRWSTRWAGHGVHTRLGDHTDLVLLSRLHAHTAAHHRFTPLSIDYLARLYHELTPSEHAHLFIAEVNTIPVAALLATGCGGVLKTRISGFDRTTTNTELRVPAAIRWHTIGWAQQHHYRWFDFGGLSAPSTHRLLTGQPLTTTALPGPDQFKLSFGATPYAYPPAVELIAPGVRHLYDLSTHTPGAHHLQTLLRAALRGGHHTRQ
jgi:lipid II:glycine glycyltransferase (peptidoglycan interpeptide bridge formation enzyme)